MSDLRRILDEEGGDDLARELIESAEQDAPDPEARARTIAMLGTAGAIGAATSAQGTVAWKLLGLTAWKWLVVVVLAGAALVLFYPREVASPPVKTPAQVTAPLPTVTEAPAPSAGPAPTVTEPAPPQVVMASSASASSPAKAAPSASAPRVGLSEETAMIDEARAALSSGDAKRALLLLDKYDREARQRMLGPEATMVRIEALEARGDKAGARALAKRFLTTSPGSTYEDRVRSLLGEVSAP